MYDYTFDITDLDPVFSHTKVNNQCVVTAITPNYLTCKNLNATTNATFSKNVTLRNTTPNDLVNSNVGALVVSGGLGVGKNLTINGNVNIKGNLVQNGVDVTSFDGFPENQFIRNFATTTTGWSSGVLAPNGKIYGIPRNSTSVLIFDPVTKVVDTTTISGLPLLGNDYASAVVAANGKIYCAPITSNKWLVINPLNNTTALVTFARTGSGNVIGCALGANGKIYTVPDPSNGDIYIMDPVTDTVAIGPKFGLAGDAASTRTFYGAVLGIDGKIYCVPNSTSTNLAVINTETNTISSITITGGTNLYAGGCLAPNGKIYCIPQDATGILVIDTNVSPATSTVIGSLAGTNKWWGGVLARNGCIYGIPSTATQVLIINTNTSVETVSLGTVSSGGLAGGVLAQNNNIYAIPASAANVAQIKTGLPILPKWMLQPQYNKF